MPSSKKRSSPSPRRKRRTPAARKPAVRRKRAATRRAPVTVAEVVVVTPIDPLAATQPGYALSTVAATELEAFATVLRRCKRAVATFTDDQREKLRTILSRAHRALEEL